MSAEKRSIRGALGALVAFVGMSAVAGLLVTMGVTPAIAVTGVAAKNSIGAFEGLPEYLSVGTLDQTSTMYATKGGQPVPIATFYAQNRDEVAWDQIAQVAKDATVATEDPRFYQHGGVDIVGTIRGAIATYLHHDVQGGSSIAQQYVKNVLIQKCEKLNVVVGDAAAQKSQDAKYKACYNDATNTTPSRKLKEMKYAIGLEKKYTKNQILQSYLNITGFGGTVYGIQAASQYYFNVPASGLNLPQAATLVAILNNPANLRIDQDKATNPDNNVDNGFKLTLERRNYVLDRMVAAKKITAAQRDEAVKTPIQPTITKVPTGCMTANAVNAGAFCDYVQRIIESDTAFGKTADERTSLFNRGGLKIYTTLNLDLQATAQSALNQYVPQTMNGVDIGGTNVSVEVGTGRVVTMVQNQPYNNTDQPDPGTTSVNYNTPFALGNSQGFQTGSTWKAFDLIEWLKEGHALNDVIDGSRTSYPQSLFHASAPCDSPGGGTWNVQNDDGPAGKYTVMAGTAESVNTVFATMATKLDLCGIKQSAQSLLVDGADNKANPFTANPSFVLGTNYIAPISMAVAYAGLANNGVACSAVAIDKITDAAGKDLPAPKTSCSTKPIDPKVAAGVVYALQGVLTGGTGAAANPHDGVPIFGKTGTTDDAYDNWLVTSTTKVAQATWVGNIQGVPDSRGNPQKTSIRNLTLGGAYGGNAKLYIAKQVITALNKAYGGDKFTAPSSTVMQGTQISVPDLTGKSPADAQSILTGLGLVYQDGGQVDSTLPAGQVASTNPPAGTSVGLGGTVTVASSNGSLIAVPTVAGKSASDAITALAQAGFNVTYSGSPKASVTGTDPAAGTGLHKGDTVTLQVIGGGTQPEPNTSTPTPRPGQN